MEDRVKLTADDSDYTNVMRRAGNTADQFTNRIDRASRGFTQLFRRSPDRRAELALSNLGASLVSGDLAGAVSSFAHRMSGLGLVAGVAVGAAAAVFEKFHKQIEETRQAQEALQAEMIKRPLSIVSQLSDEGMAQALEGRQKARQDLTQKSQKTFGSEIAETFMSMIAGPGMGGSQKEGKERLDEQKDINKVSGEEQTIMADRAKLAEKLLAIKKQELSGDERGAELAKIALQTEQARAAIKLKGLPHDVEARFEKNILQNEELSIKEADQKANNKEINLQFQERMAQVQRDGLAGDDLKKARLAFEINDIKERVATEPNSMTRRELKVQRMEKENELRLLTPRQPARNQFPFGTAASRSFESEFGEGGFTRRNIEDSLGFGGLARRSMERGESLTPEEALLKSGSATADKIAGFRKNVGDLPSGPGQSPDVVAAIQKLTTLIESVWR